MILCIVVGFIVLFKFIMNFFARQNKKETLNESDLSELTFEAEDNEYFNGFNGSWNRLLIKRRLVIYMLQLSHHSFICLEKL